MVQHKGPTCGRDWEGTPVCTFVRATGNRAGGARTPFVAKYSSGELRVDDPGSVCGMVHLIRRLCRGCRACAGDEPPVEHPRILSAPFDAIGVAADRRRCSDDSQQVTIASRSRRVLRGLVGAIVAPDPSNAVSSFRTRNRPGRKEWRWTSFHRACRKIHSAEVGPPPSSR